ncbi:MAG: 50S ribosomal protein L17 [Planctomycetes bacterium]|nr:50S ribosomal protein L17 [Planctomycetota bacterium]
MRHRVAGRKLARTTAHRKALAKNLIRSLFDEFERKDFIVTTREKAKFAQPQAERLISLGRTKNLHNIRRAMATLQDRDMVAKLFDKIGPYYASRPGGYTRVIRLAKPRLGDNATRAYFGFVRASQEAPEAAPEAAKK